MPDERRDVGQRQQHAEVDAEHQARHGPSDTDSEAVEQVQVEGDDGADRVKERTEGRLQGRGQRQQRNGQHHVVFVHADPQHEEGVDDERPGERM